MDERLHTSDKIGKAAFCVLLGSFVILHQRFDHLLFFLAQYQLVIGVVIKSDGAKIAELEDKVSLLSSTIEVASRTWPNRYLMMISPQALAAKLNPATVGQVL